jgi:hypothetical protein
MSKFCVFFLGRLPMWESVVPLHLSNTLVHMSQNGASGTVVASLGAVVWSQVPLAIPFVCGKTRYADTY